MSTPYDYLSTMAPDVADTFTVAPQQIMTETFSPNQEVLVGDDGSREALDYTEGIIVSVTLQWDTLTASDAGAIVSHYSDPTKANKMANSFPWAHPTDGHTYVTMYADPLPRTIATANIHGVTSIKLYLIGKVLDV